MLQTDSGGEYVSSRFENFLKCKGISHMLSCPYTPHQNAIAEMKHQHIVETAITLMTLPSYLNICGIMHVLTLSS